MKEILEKAINSIHELTKETCELCGGTYEENLNGTIHYFALGDAQFKISFQKIK